MAEHEFRSGLVRTGIKAEAAALWRELYNEPAPALADGGEMLDLMLRRLPPAGYERIASPHLRRGGLTFPKRAR